jgi:hypothetical protein
VASKRVEQNVLVVSIDRLIPSLRGGVGGLGPADELGTRGFFGRRERHE